MTHNLASGIRCTERRSCLFELVGITPLAIPRKTGTNPSSSFHVNFSYELAWADVAMTLNRIHHVAIICSDYPRSKAFYTGILGLQVVAEHYRAGRDSWKLDLALPDGAQLELFSFPSPPSRPSYPEACGLRHLAFEVEDVERWKQQLEAQGVVVEPVRVDEFTNRRFVFFSDPDGLPLELYERLPVHD